MIGYLKGQVLDHSEGKMLLDTGGIGYSVTIPQSAAYLGLSVGKTAEFFVYTHVREDSLDLYGFSSKPEKELFLTLLSVNGIGPKVAMGILSNAEPEKIVHAILNGDRAALSDLPGIGKKTAERVVLELKDTMKKKLEMGLFGDLLYRNSGGTGAVSAHSDRMVKDAKDALMGLGYRESDVLPAIHHSIVESSNDRVEDLVKRALQRLK